MAIMIEQKAIQNSGSKNSEASSFTRAVEKIIKAGKVVCIKNFEIVLPSFSEIKLYFFNKIYIFKDTKDNYFKMKFVDFYDDNGKKGYPKMAWELLK